MYIYITPSRRRQPRWCGGNECLADLRQRLLIRPAASRRRCIALFCCLICTRHRAVYGAAQHCLDTKHQYTPHITHKVTVYWWGWRPWPFPPLHHVAASIRGDQPSQAASHSSGESAASELSHELHTAHNEAEKGVKHKATTNSTTQSTMVQFYTITEKSWGLRLWGCGVVSVQWSWWRELFTGSLTFITVD